MFAPSTAVQAQGAQFKAGDRGEIQSRQNELMFSCLKNEAGEWQCNAGEGKLGELKFIKK